MRKFIILLSGAFLFCFAQNTVKAQNVLDGIYVKEHVPARKPVPYHHLREADMMWTKRIWRMLDLREKINHPLYYPNVEYKDQPVNDRYSLIGLLLHGIKDNGLVTYDPFYGDEFGIPLADTTLESNLGGGDDLVETQDPETLQWTTKKVKLPMKLEEVERAMLKEVWYIDKQRAKMEVRIVGIMPIRMSKKEGQSVKSPNKVFWAYYPSIRNLFANAEVFNPNNDAERRTFEDIFWKRRFSSYIYRKTNVYNNRRIGEYETGLDALLEAKKIKMHIFEMEHDIWEF